MIWTPFVIEALKKEAEASVALDGTTQSFPEHAPEVYVLIGERTSSDPKDHYAWVCNVFHHLEDAEHERNVRQEIPKTHECWYTYTIQGMDIIR